MPSKGKKNIQKTVIKLSYKDLVRRIEGQPPQQVKKGDPEWNNGIECIHAYYSQATVLSQADQEEMRDIIQCLGYVIPPSAEDEPLCHTLMIAQLMKMEKGKPPSWAAFIILKTLYGDDLPAKYVECVRYTFGRTEVDDHTDEYFAIKGTELPEPTTAEEDHPTSPWQDENLDDKAKVFKETKKRGASALDIEDGSSSANKRTKVAGASSLSFPETNNEDRRDPMAIYVQLANAVSEQQTAEEVDCECTIGKLREMINKKFEAMQDAAEKKIEDEFKAMQENLERKEKERSEAHTKEIRMMREALEKKMEEKSGTQTKELQMIREPLEKKAEEKIEAQTKELQRRHKSFMEKL